MEHPFWKYAKQAAKEVGWFPETILSQWMVETNHFRSNVFKKNNNIAGQTWYEGCGHEKGTVRPKAEGGYYIKYKNPVDGYVEFIKKNRRYSKVKNEKTVEDQIRAIAKAGWAVDPHYAATLISVHHANLKKNNYHTDAPKPIVKPNPAPYKGISLVDYLKSKGKPIDFASRRILAREMGLSHYSGNAEENTKLLEILRKKWGK